MIRIFEHQTSENKEWRELTLIDEEKDLIKIYAQDKKLGFPFSDEYPTSLKEYGYKSADDYYKSLTKRHKNNVGHSMIKEIEATEQIASEIAGLIKLAKHRNDNGNYKCLILKDGTLYNDIIERLKQYGLTEEKALELINLYLDHEIERHCVKVVLEDDILITSINGTTKEIKDHYEQNQVKELEFIY